MKTKEKIVQASLKLFNQKGERAITTNHIADYLNISPGLLYYHFKNKEEIIREIFARYIEHISNAIEMPTDTSVAAEFLGTYSEQIFESIWRFRFLHSNMPSLLTQDRELHQQYLQAHSFLEDRASSSIVWMRERELIEIDESDIPILVDLMRLVTGFWVGFSIANQPTTRLTKAQVHAGMEHLIALLVPYGTAKGKPIFKALKVAHESQDNASKK